MTVPPPRPASAADAPESVVEDRRFAELNALAGVLPYHRRDELSSLLSDADVATLRHLVDSVMRNGPIQPLMNFIESVFSWPACLNGSFLHPSNHFDTSSGIPFPFSYFSQTFPRNWASFGYKFVTEF